MLQNQLVIASVSLGQHALHTLPDKISAAADNALQGIEITFTDLQNYATSLGVSIVEAASLIGSQCLANNLAIIAFAPFENFEGQRSPLEDRLAKAQEWLTIADVLGAEHFQVPSNYDRTANGDRRVIASELRQLSDLANQYSPPIKIAYENLGWARHCSLWQEAMDIVKAVDRDNFGLCLDSFHLCVALWADPFAQSGVRPNGARALRQSLRELVQRLPLEKLFYLQLSDGERLDPPYSETHPWFDPTLQPAHVWSNEARPFPLEKDLGGYMPVEEVARAVLVELGFAGWVSLETFDRRMRLEHNGPQQNARRAARSWQALEDALKRPKAMIGRL